MTSPAPLIAPREGVADALKALLGKDLIAYDFAVGEDSITVRRDAIAGVMVQLRDALDYQQLMEIAGVRSEEHTSELQSLMRISYAVFCLKKKTIINMRPDIITHNK